MKPTQRAPGSQRTPARTGPTLYRKSGFAEEGRLTKQYRRASGELWDAIVMGMLLVKPSMPTQNAAYEVRPPLQLTDGSVQLPAAVLKVVLVSA
ncbi:MAG TPA: hypothetical protein VFJ07_22290 [Streptosporangiaceae bacterium]|nr:hypothetical protein [Streptosporangiaceae bacterium]